MRGELFPAGSDKPMDLANLNHNLLLVQFDGAPAQLLQCASLVQSQTDWDASAPSDTLELLPIGHTPGVYHVSAPVLLRTVAAGAGILDREISCNTPVLGAVTVAGPGGSAIGVGAAPAPTMLAPDVTAVVSDGTAPITVRYVPSGVVQPCLIDWYATAELAGALPIVAP